MSMHTCLCTHIYAMYTSLGYRRRKMGEWASAMPDITADPADPKAAKVRRCLSRMCRRMCREMCVEVCMVCTHVHMC